MSIYVGEVLYPLLIAGGKGLPQSREIFFEGMEGGGEVFGREGMHQEGVVCMRSDLEVTRDHVQERDSPG